MSRIHRRLAPSYLALATAAGLLAATPALAANTTTTIVVGQTVSAAGTSSPVIVASPAAGDTFTINNAGTIRSTSGNAVNRQAIGGDGAGAVVINNDGLIRGDLLFGSASGPVTLTNTSLTGQGWLMGGTSTLSSASDSIVNQAGGLIRFGTGSASLDFGAGNDGLSNSGLLDMSASSTSLFFGDGDDTLANNDSGVISFSGSSLLVDFGAGNDSLSNSGLIDMSASSASLFFGDGNDTLTNSGSGIVSFGGSSLLVDFGAGDDALSNAADSVIATNGAATLDFGTGNDTLTNAGRLIAGRQSGASSLTLSNLETFNNSGLILLGSTYSSSAGGGLVSDYEANDVLNAQGVAFTGSGDSRIAMDASLAGVAQADCSALTAADCVDFTGGSTAGSTLLTIHDASSATPGGLNDGIALIVGSSAAGDFSLDPNSDGYVTTSFGPALQKGAVDYRLVYDAAAKKHLLVGVPTGEAAQGVTVAASAQEVWRSAAAGFFDRQADLRATPGGLSSSNGLWGRLGAETSQQDSETSVTQGPVVTTYDLGRKQKTAQLLVGMDVLGASSQDSAWVFGGMIGFVRSDVDYDRADASSLYTGFTGGVYLSYLAGPLFIDGLFNVDQLSLEADVPHLNLGTEVKMTQTVRSLGGRLEAGWKIPLGAVSVEPLADVAYVKTRLDDIDIPGGLGSLSFADGAKSLRAGAGVRVAMASDLLGLTAAYSLTARYWNEMEADNRAAFTTGSTSAPLQEDLGGGYSDVKASVDLYSSGGGLSGFASLGGQFASGYHAVDGAVGVRLRW